MDINDIDLIHSALIVLIRRLDGPVFIPISEIDNVEMLILRCCVENDQLRFEVKKMQ